MSPSLPEVRRRYPGAITFRFGDSAALNEEILGLVRAGRKTMTCDALRAFEERGEKVPEPGEVSIALDPSGAPAVVIRTLSISHVPFDQVTEDLVPDQGEFKDLADWRTGYGAYLKRSGVFAPDVMMIIERFEVVEVF
ncbi:MAG: ASCH domain-containing protein [Pseudomonadota bacterium]